MAPEDDGEIRMTETPIEQTSPAPEQDSSQDFLTVKTLARHKSLPVEFLRDLGVIDGRRRRVLIAYQTAEGGRARARVRTALVAREGSRWTGGKGVPKRSQLEPPPRVVAGDGSAAKGRISGRLEPCVA